MEDTLRRLRGGTEDAWRPAVYARIEAKAKAMVHSTKGRRWSYVGLALDAGVRRETVSKWHREGRLPFLNALPGSKRYP